MLRKMLPNFGFSIQSNPKHKKLIKHQSMPSSFHFNIIIKIKNLTKNFIKQTNQEFSKENNKKKNKKKLIENFPHLQMFIINN